MSFGAQITSSITSNAPRRILTIEARQQHSTSISRFLIEPSMRRSWSIASISFNCVDLIVEALHSTTPRFFAADSSLATVLQGSTEERST
eukprot:3209716-Prymnesium_polylepis.1